MSVGKPSFAAASQRRASAQTKVTGSAMPSRTETARELKRVVGAKRVPVDQAGGGAVPYSAASAMPSADPKWLNMPANRLRSGGR